MRSLLAVRPRTLPLLLALALCPQPVLSQESNSTLEGRVLAAGSGEPIRQATVRVLGTERTVLTDTAGRFRIARLQPGVQALSFGALGYGTRVLEVPLPVAGRRWIEVILPAQPLPVEALVVTAQKRQQAVQEVPVTMTVYDGEFLRSTGIEDVAALSQYVPGLEVQVQSPNNAGFVVRGITSDEGDPRHEARVSVFQDGVSISRSQASVVELFDLERIEVLKGPQGTLFGRAAEIGALHLVQQKPTRQRAAQLSVGTGNLGQWSLSGFANAPLVEERLFARVAGTYGQREGYIENGAGGTLNARDVRALRGLLRWTPAELTRLDLIVNWQHDDLPGIAFLNGSFVPAPGVPLSRERGYLGGDDRFPALGVDRTVRGATLLADHGLDARWTLQTIGAFRDFDSYEVFDADGTGAPALTLAEDARGEQASLELRALYGGRRLNGFFGVSGFWQEASQRIPFWTDPRNFFPLLTRVISVRTNGAFPEIPFIADGHAVLVPGYPPGIEGLADVLVPDDAGRREALRALLGSLVGQPVDSYHQEASTSDARNTAFDVFADGTLSLSDRLQLTAGVRATFERLRSGYLVQAGAAPQPLGLGTGAFPNLLFAPTPGGERITHAKSFSALVGRLAADLTLRPDLHLFASAARGRRPPVLQQVEPAAVGNPVTAFEVLNAETVNSYEAGLKGMLFDQRLQYDLAAFRYDYHDFQMNVEAEWTPSGIVFHSDQAEATGYGAEASLQAAVAQRLSLFGNYAYLHAAFDAEDATGEPQPLAGNAFRLSPEHSLSAGFGYSAPVGRLGRLFVRPSYTWKSRVCFEEGHQGGTVLDRLAPPLSQEAHGLLNVRAGIASVDGRLEVEAWAANLLDEDYLIDAGNTGLNFFLPTYVPGPPRLIGLRVTARR